MPAVVLAPEHSDVILSPEHQIVGAQVNPDSVSVSVTPADADGRRVRMAEVQGSEGVQAGENNVQVNFFSNEESNGPVVAGNVPQAPPAFQPREILMAQLRAAGPGVSVVRALTGMRGVGKTQLAAAYARECIDAGWRLVAWIDAEDMVTTLGGLASIANRLGIGRVGVPMQAVGEEVRNRVEADGERCLIVYDNVADPDALRPYIPSAGKSRIVITSTQAGALALGKPTQIEVFSERESVDFLVERTGLHESEGARLIAAELGGLPLALGQAAAVIRSWHLSYGVYLTRLRSYPTSRYLPPAKGEQYPRGVAEAILLSIDAAAADDGTGLCVDLLGVISLLSPDGVLRDLLYHAESDHFVHASEEAIDEALARLADASLLAFSGDAFNPTVSAHRLVMRVVRERYIYAGTLSDLGTKTCGLLQAAIGALDSPWRDPEAALILVQQVLAVSDHLAPYHAVLSDQLARGMLVGRAWATWCLTELGRAAGEAAHLGEPLVAETARVLGEDHPDTLTSRSYLAYAYWRMGRFDDAVRAFEGVLSDRVRVLGEGHPHTSMSRHSLATVYRMVGRLSEAVPLFERLLVEREQTLGEDHPDTMICRNALAPAYRAAGRRAMAHQHAGRLCEAIPLFEQALSGLELIFGSTHPETVRARENLMRALAEATRQREREGCVHSRAPA
jgi:tetratricopeptide (TPR) repeat protein